MERSRRQLEALVRVNPKLWHWPPTHSHHKAYVEAVDLITILQAKARDFLDKRGARS
jgi:hypothetical protein